MKILVVGGRGFLGSLICNLMCQSHEVTSVDTCWFESHLDERVEDIPMDAFFLHCLEGYDSVIYVAGVSNDPMADINPCETFSHNVGLPFHLAKIAKRDKVKSFIYASSCSVYGWKNSVVTEEDIPATESYYGTSKLLGERVQYLAADDFNVVIFRMGTLSGVSPRMRFDLLFNTMFASVKQTGKITVNCPDIWRPVLHVKEAAKIYALAAEKNCFSGVFNLASFNCTILEAAQVVQKYLGGEIDIKNGTDVRNYAADTSKIKSIVSLESTPDSIVLDLKENNFIHDYADDRYSNIKTYQKIMKYAERK